MDAEENEERKKYNMRTDRKEVYPKVQVKLKKKRRKKYELRQLTTGGMLKYEQLCRMNFNPHDCCRIFIDAHISYGIFTTRPVEQNEVLLEYKGKLVSREESEALHKYYARKGVGCYIVDFVHNEQKLSIDATEAIDTLGRYVNDSMQRYANCEMKKFLVDDIPHLFLVAKKDISAGMELRYDYGDHTQNLYWRGITCYKKPLRLDDVVSSWKSDFCFIANNLRLPTTTEATINTNSEEDDNITTTEKKIGITTISNVNGQVTAVNEEVWVQ